MLTRHGFCLRCWREWRVVFRWGAPLAAAGFLLASGLMVADHLWLRQETARWQQMFDTANTGWQQVAAERLGCEVRSAARSSAAADQQMVLGARAATCEATLAVLQAYCRHHRREGACRIVGGRTP